MNEWKKEKKNKNEQFSVQVDFSMHESREKASFHWWLMALGSCDINIFTFTVYRHFVSDPLLLRRLSLLLSVYRIFHPFDILEPVHITYLWWYSEYFIYIVHMHIEREWMNWFELRCEPYKVLTECLQISYADFSCVAPMLRFLCARCFFIHSFSHTYPLFDVTLFVCTNKFSYTIYRTIFPSTIRFLCYA